MIPPAVGHVIAGKYRLERPLSRGGMGAVWVARHLELGMAVAVKLMDPLTAARPSFRQRFAREAKAAAAIQSPHVVKVHDYGVDGETPYLVMELLHGEDLGTRLRREGRLGLEATARLALAIAKGLKRAHEAGVVHRDLKPANVFLTRVDEDEIVQILDFGIARLTRGEGESERTETGVVMGSIHYMSPEQARGFRDADHRADVWSLGVIAYRALTGELPFPGEETGDVLVKVCTDPVPAASARLRTLEGRVARELDRFFARALARSPAQRFQTARELADALCVIAGVEVETTTARVAATTTEDQAEDAPSKTDAIPGLAAPAASGAIPAQPDDTAGISSTIDGPASASKRAAPSRRVAWAIGAAVAVGALAALLIGLAHRGEPDTTPSPARVTGSASPAETATAATTNTSSYKTADTAPTAPPEAASAAAPKATASASAPGKPPPAAAPRPTPKPEDKVKVKFGF